MPRTWTIQPAFNGGELSPELEGRTDIEAYQRGLYCCENFIPRVNGTLWRRPGFRYKGTVDSGSLGYCIIKSFEAAGNQTYLVEQGSDSMTASGTLPMYLKVWKNGSVLGINNGAGKISTPWWTLENSIGSGFAESKIRDAQTADTMFLANLYAAPRKLQRFSDTVWTVAPVKTVGPFKDIDPDNTNSVVVSAPVDIAVSGTGAVASSGYSSAYSGANAFDGNTASEFIAYHAGSNSSGNVWLGQDFGSDVSPESVRLYWPSAKAIPSSMKVQYSANGSSWSDQATYSISANTGWQTLDIVSPALARYWRVLAVSAAYSNIRIAEMTFQSARRTLTSTADLFTAADVGRHFYLENPKNYALSSWEPGKVVSIGDYRRSDGKTYEALSAGTTGTVTPVHSEGSRKDGDGGVTWQYRDPGFGAVRIVSYTNAKTVTVEEAQHIPTGVITPGSTTRYAFDAWNDTDGWPDHVCFFRERLVFARSTDQRLWFSVVKSYEDFSTKDDNGQVVADMGFSMQVVASQVNSLSWMHSAEGLIIGTEKGLYFVQELQASTAFGPKNAVLRTVSDLSCSPVQPARLGTEIIFAGETHQSLFAMEYDSVNENYSVTDLMSMTPHLTDFSHKISAIVAMHSPEPMIWVCIYDYGAYTLAQAATLYSCTYSKAQKVLAWSRHPVLLEAGSNSSAAVEGITSSRQTSTGGYPVTALNAVVNRMGIRTIETMEFIPEWKDTVNLAVNLMARLDGLVSKTVASSRVSGLDYLAGLGVTVLYANGDTASKTVSASGTLSGISGNGTAVSVGTQLASVFATLTEDAGQDTGTAQGKTKRISHVVVRTYRSNGGTVGATETGAHYSIPFSGAIPFLNTGDFKVPFPSRNTGFQRVWYINSSPWPSTILAVMKEVDTYD